jgi:hypothetical protein
MTDASIFAAESQFGSLSIDKTDRIIDSKTNEIRTKKNKRKYLPTD